MTTTQKSSIAVPIDLKLNPSDVKILIRFLEKNGGPEWNDEQALLAHLRLRYSLSQRGTLVEVI